MERLIKVTYFDGYDLNKVKAKQFKIFGWYNFGNALANLGIQDAWVIKAEIVLDVPAEAID